MILRIPQIWQRTSRYTQAVACHVLTHKGREGMLERYADGGYPLYYAVGPSRARMHSAVCPKCASDLFEWGLDDDRVVAADVNWEDPDMFCDCGARIESAYAEPEDTSDKTETEVTS